MLVVIGNPRARRLDGGRIEGAGMGHAISIAAASRGADVQVVGRVGEDDAGDRVLLDVARRGIGHVAVLRVAGRATIEAPRRASVLGLEDDSAPADEPVTGPDILEAADIQLALSYLPEYRVIVVAERLGDDALRAVSDAVRWSGAALVVVGRADDLAGLPDDATVFAPPDDGDPDGAFAAMVGAYAAGLDRGEDPRAAFEAAQASVGSTAAE